MAHEEHDSTRRHVLAELQSLEGICAPNTTRVKYLCFDVSKRYLALGATSGDVFLFQREPLSFVCTVTNKEGSVVQVSFGPDDGIIGIATSRGHVVVVEHHADHLSAQRLQLSYEHKGTTVTCLRWNGTGSGLFVGDNQGKVSLITISKAKDPPNTLMRLDSKIVQLDFAQDRLLASTLTRCYIGDTLREKFVQVGKKLRDGEFGCCFLSSARSPIYVARPGCRIWEADLRGNVLKTHKFKDSLSFPPTKCVSYRHRLNEDSLSGEPQGAAFSRLLCLSSSEKAPLILSWSVSGIYIIDPHKAEMILWTDDFKDIRDIRLVHNRIYIQLSNSQFHVCSLLSLENAVISLFKWHHFNQCAQFLLANHHRISKNSFQQNIPAGLVFDLMDGLSNGGRPLLSSRIAKLVHEKYEIDRRPLKGESKGSAIPRLDTAGSSPRHVRCHSSDRATSPKLSRRIPRCGSDPLCWTDKTSVLSETMSLQVASSSEALHDNGDMSAELSEQEKKLDTSGKAGIDLPLQLENLNQKMTDLVDEHLNNNKPELSDKSGQRKPSCSANGKCGITSRPLPAIPASPLESPLSPLDGVNPLTNMYAEQDVGYESVYQYLNLGLCGAGIVPSAFSVRPSELMQLANVADLSKLKETLSSKYLNSKQMLLKNLRGFESRIKYFSIESGMDVLSPGSPTVEEGQIELAKPPEKMMTPQDDFWLFLPPLGANLIEATLKASETLSNPQVLFSMPKLSKVLNEWVTILHSSQVDVLNHIASTDPCKLLVSPVTCASEASQLSNLQHSAERNLKVIQSIFTSDPFHLSCEVKSKAKELAMLCFQMDLLGDTQVIELAVAQHKDSQNKVRETLTGRNPLKYSSSNSFESEETSTECDLSLSMQYSEKRCFHLPDALESCSESIMFQSTSLGGASINLDFRLDDTVEKEHTSVSHRVMCIEPNDTFENGAKLPSNQCSEENTPQHACQGLYEEKVKLPKVPGNFGDVGTGEGPLLGDSSKFFATGEVENWNLARRLHSDLSPSMTSQSDVLSWMPIVQSTNIKLQSPSSNDMKMSCFIHNYFYLLDVETVWDIIQATVEPCYLSWSAAVAGLSMQTKGKFLEYGVEKGRIVTEFEKLDKQPARMLGCLAFLQRQDPVCVEDVLLKKVDSLTARDILYFSRYINAHPSLFIKAMHRAFIAFPLPQMLSSVRKYLENNEVRWEWVNQSLDCCDLQCLKCPCGAPRTWSHKVSWPRADYLNAVLFNDQWVSIQSMQVCQLYGFWPGYLYSLKHLGFRFEHLVTIIQLGDVELMSRSHQYGLLPENEEEWKLAFELVQKQQKSSNHAPTCLFCDQVLDSSEALVTVENLARRMLDSLGPASQLLECLPKGSLSPHLFFSGALITIIGQQQHALKHRILSRVESYLWSRRPICIPPQIADVLEKEKQGLASMETDVQVHHLYGEEADGHWGRTITLLSSCASCKQLLGTPCNAVVVRHCGHTFHNCCLLGDFCVVCLETQGTGTFHWRVNPSL